MKRWLLLVFFLGLTVFARCWNWRQVVVDGQLYFVDADCYSRMTRVAAVLANPFLILRHHDFENWPFGTIPHTTVPLDYLIAALVPILRNVDLAGAVAPVLLAAASVVVLWKWLARFPLLTQSAVLLTFAVSPILVHGTVLGRPDHQALLIFLLIATFATEWELQLSNPARSIAILHGLSWGLALWTSLFEPAILFLAGQLLGIALWRRLWFTRARGLSAIVTGSILLVALLVEHWRISSLPAGPLFDRWSRSIGELSPVGWFSPIYLSWFGLAVLVLPGVLLWRIFREKNRAAVFWGSLLLLNYVLCASAARWGYFLGLAVLFALPFLFEKSSLLFAVLFFLGFWPVASEWDARLWPAPTEQARLAEQQEDYRQLRQICQSIDPAKGRGVLAPWWLSPPIAYWSGAAGVAGSSHQSLPGNEAAALFYLSRFPEKARALLHLRRVRWVVAYEPDRVLSTASSLVDMPPSSDALGSLLYNEPRRAPAFLELVRETTFFRLYRVKD